MKTYSRLRATARNRISDLGLDRNNLILYCVFVVATLMLGTGVIVYDAIHYWGGAESIVAGTLVFTDLSFRGFLSVVVYVPAAFLNALFGSQIALFAVLLQNALVLGLVAVFLLPKLAGYWRPVGARGRGLGALLFWLVTVGFAPYPLVDLYPVLALLTMLALFQAKFPGAIVVAGFLAGIAVNIRPAYLVPVILVVLVVVVWRRWSSLMFIGGMALGLLPQFLLNGLAFKEWTIWPIGSDSLIALQASYAAYVVRYDTFLGSEAPQQFYCSPALAAQLQGALPTSPGELASTFLGNMPNSIIFSLQKIAAALQWPHSTPYTVPAPGLDVIFAATVTAITVVGLLAALRIAIVSRAKWSTNVWFNRAAFAALVVGAVLTLVSSATEARFALPLVLLGVIGCMTLPTESVRSAVSRRKVWVAVSLLLVLVVSFFGYKGLSHPAPAGGVDQLICASLLR